MSPKLWLLREVICTLESRDRGLDGDVPSSLAIVCPHYHDDCPTPASAALHVDLAVTPKSGLSGGFWSRPETWSSHTDLFEVTPTSCT